MHCELYIPDFFPPEGLPRANSLAAAETLIARGRRRRAAQVSREAWLFGRFGVPRQRDWPVAPYTLLADGGAPGPHYWMRADPVHLQVGRDSLGLADSAAFEVSRAESDALVDALNRHFGQTMLFQPLRPARWYVRLEKAPDVQTTPAAAARGVAIDEKLPSWPDAMRFHALMNEAQMLLHEHPVNAEREARGVPSLNSIWFCGAGVIAAAKARPFSAANALEPLARAPAQAAIGLCSIAVSFRGRSPKNLLCCAQKSRSFASLWMTCHPTDVPDHHPPGSLARARPARARGPAPGAGAHLRRARDQQARRAR